MSRAVAGVCEVPCCHYCPDSDSLDIVFALVADPCPTSCTPTSQPSFWFKNTSLPINGGHSLPNTSPSEVWTLNIPNAYEFDHFSTDDCGEESSPGLADLIITIICSNTPNTDGKHLSLLVDAVQPGGGGLLVYRLFDLTDPTDWFNFDEEVTLTGCGGTVIVSQP